MPISSNAYNGALYLPAGIPVDYFVPLQRLFVGDNDHATADAVFDRYLFKLDPATVRGDRARGHFRLLVQNGMDPDRGLTSFLDLTSFALFATNSAGAPVGPAIRSGNEFDAPLDVGERYVLQLLGNLGGAINADKFGRYVIQFTPTAPVPLPPAGLLLLSVLLPMAVRFRLRDARGGKPA